MHTVEQLSLMDEEGVLLSFPSSISSSSFFFDMEVNVSIVSCENTLLIKKLSENVVSFCVLFS